MMLYKQALLAEVQGRFHQDQFALVRENGTIHLVALEISTDRARVCAACTSCGSCSWQSLRALLFYYPPARENGQVEL